MKKFSIYQLNEQKKNARYMMFSRYELLERMELANEVKESNYSMVYEANLLDKDDLDVLDTLELLYAKFNFGAKPSGFSGDSLSVSDVVKLEDEFYFVDDFGFRKLKNFSA